MSSSRGTASIRSSPICTRAAPAAPELGASPPDWEQPFETLRRKWGTVPAGGGKRLSTQHMLAMSDAELLSTWQGIRTRDTTGPLYSHRGWYHDLYRDVLSGKRVADVGSGMGLDGITFAQAGTRMTFVDLVPENLLLIERLCGLLGVADAEFFALSDLADLRSLRGSFDVIWAQGSLHHAPPEFIRDEVQRLLERLPVGGRWIQLAYPKRRWEREGRLPFEQWGEVTDGPGTPWAEWYDIDKLRAALAPATFDILLHFNFHNDEFNWFDLVRRT